LAKAVATESKANFISIKGSDIFNKWVGESEKKVKEIFKKARLLAPSIVFFDEIDAITSRKVNDNSTNVTNNVVAELLTEMDGVSKLNDVIVIGATNRIDLIDSAFLRPGRFDRLVYVSLPSLEEQEKIFDVYLNKLTVDKKITSKDLVKMLNDKDNKYSGADIEAICNEASMICIRRLINNNNKDKEVVTKEDFKQAIEQLKKKDEKESNYQMIR
jgi:transitional endoplasmic reticulum ATPase